MNTSSAWNERNAIIDIKEARHIEAIERYKDIKEAQSLLAKEEKELKQFIIDAMTDNKLVAGSYTALLKITTSTGLDTDRIRADFPEMWTEYGKTTERKTLVIG